MVIIGVDPDANKSGFAFYEDGKLKDLANFDLVQLFYFFQLSKLTCGGNELHIEDIHSCKGMWHKGGSGAARRVGRCEQVQIEIERMAEYFGITVVRHKVSKKWKSQAEKKEFERLTGWTGRTNEDQRSAAYFGYLGCK